MRRVRIREMENLFSGEEVAAAGGWLVAPRYYAPDGRIVADNDPYNPPDLIHGKNGGVRWTKPLGDPDAFLSFTRLAAHGKPSRDAIWDWVRRYGLLYRLDTSSPHPGVEWEEARGRKRRVYNQKPMTLEEFGREARHAYLLRRLYEMLRADDWPALRERLAQDSTDAYRSCPGGPVVRKICFGELELLGVMAARGDTGVRDYLDQDRLLETRVALEKHIEKRIQGVEITFSLSGGFAVSCPDLRTALYWQFACLVAGKRPFGICDGCKGTFVKTRKDKRFCNSTCRSNNYREKNT